MPTYDYKCQSCGNAMRLMQPIADRRQDLTLYCEVCEAVKVFDRMLSAPMVNMNGQEAAK